eukprot:11975402-Karenia_brevis.AAC.1
MIVSHGAPLVSKRHAKHIFPSCHVAVMCMLLTALASFTTWHAIKHLPPQGILKLPCPQQRLVSIANNDDTFSPGSFVHTFQHPVM